MKYYHLDRGHRLHEGMVIQNSKQPIVPLTQQEFDALFPNGLSHWGKSILTNHQYISYFPGLNWDHFTSDGRLQNIIIEILFESARKSLFPTKPSRLSSFFALQRLRDFSEWGEIADFHHIDSLSIYEIEVPECAPCFDSSVLGIGLKFGYSDNHNPGFQIFTAQMFHFAALYWNGLPSTLYEADQTPRYEYLLTPPLVIGRKVPADEIHSALHL